MASKKVKVIERERTANGGWSKVGEKSVSETEAARGAVTGKYIILDEPKKKVVVEEKE